MPSSVVLRINTFCNDFVFTPGELKVVKGILTVVTPKSGHYKPKMLQVRVGLCCCVKP